LDIKIRTGALDPVHPETVRSNPASQPKPPSPDALAIRGARQALPGITPPVAEAAIPETARVTPNVERPARAATDPPLAQRKAGVSLGAPDPKPGNPLGPIALPQGAANHDEAPVDRSDAGRSQPVPLAAAPAPKAGGGGDGGGAPGHNDRSAGTQPPSHTANPERLVAGGQPAGATIEREHAPPAGASERDQEPLNPRLAQDVRSFDSRWDAQLTKWGASTGRLSDLRLLVPVKADSGQLELNVQERGNGVRITVRGGDAPLAEAVRQDLGQLLENLERFATASQREQADSPVPRTVAFPAESAGREQSNSHSPNPRGGSRGRRKPGAGSGAAWQNAIQTATGSR
jgi:hypothetical protein